MKILDIASFLSYVALNIDMLLQIRQIHQTKSSRDLSLTGMSVRYVAIAVILTKFISLDDRALIFGQGLIFITFSTYYILAIKYKEK